jgi:ABC-type antimicrobial peptide transport system permease subunit
MFFIVYVVVAILILNAMLMAVFERIREFGIMKALGVSPGKVMTLILIESGLQTVIALFLGLTLSLPGLWYLTRVGIDTGALGGVSVMGVAYSSTWTAAVTLYTFVGPICMLLLLAFLAVLYPAVKAARISPVEAMRHQ